MSSTSHNVVRHLRKNHRLQCRPCNEPSGSLFRGPESDIEVESSMSSNKGAYNASQTPLRAFFNEKGFFSFKCLQASNALSLRMEACNARPERERHAMLDLKGRGMQCSTSKGEALIFMASSLSTISSYSFKPPRCRGTCLQDSVVGMKVIHLVQG